MSDLGTWDPLPLDDAVELFRDAAVRWWVSGGLALELHVGLVWREHADTDIGVLRAGIVHLPEVLVGWDLHVASKGALTPWDGGPLSEERAENNVWCRPDPGSAWALDVTIGDGDDDEWIFRRDRSLRVLWADAVLETAAGVPYLAPELQVLFKSRDRRKKDDLDAVTTIPLLDDERRARLRSWLPHDHPWQPLTQI